MNQQKQEDQVCLVAESDGVPDHVAGLPSQNPGPRFGLDGESGVFRIALHLPPKTVQLKRKESTTHTH